LFDYGIFMLIGYVYVCVFMCHLKIYWCRICVIYRFSKVIFNFS
jgi:hypothetical protein